MRRREFVLKTAFTVTGWVLAGCGATGPIISASDIEQHHRAIDADFYAGLERLFKLVHGSRKLVGKARGVLAFPSVVLTVAQERDGEGALRVANTMERYYRLSLPATGAPTDAASSTIIYLFMTEDALNKFRASDVWTVGAGAVTPKLTSDGGIDVRATGGPILAFVLNGDNSVATHPLQGARIAPLFS